jgi:hypothetical protein
MAAEMVAFMAWVLGARSGLRERPLGRPGRPPEGLLGVTHWQRWPAGN